MRIVCSVLFMSFTLATLPACSSSLSDEEKNSLLLKLEEVLTDSKNSDEARKAAVAALRKVQSVKTLPCKVKVLKKGEMLKVGRYDNQAAVIRPSLKLNIVYDRAGKPVKDGWRHRKVAERVAQLRRQIKNKVKAGEKPITKKLLGWAKKEIAALGDTKDVGRYELGALSTVLGHVTYNGKQFPSRIAVRVYAWDHHSRKIVCSAEVVDDIGSEVKVAFHKHEGMKDANIEHALQNNLMQEGLIKAFGLMGVGAKTGRW